MAEVKEGEQPNTVAEIIEGAGVEPMLAEFIHAIESGEIEGDEFEGDDEGAGDDL